jgi:hypothetical protein
MNLFGRIFDHDRTPMKPTGIHRLCNVHLITTLKECQPPKKQFLYHGIFKPNPLLFTALLSGISLSTYHATTARKSPVNPHSIDF